VRPSQRIYSIFVDESSLDERVCCPDDLCTGVLDPLGRCGTCGRGFDPPSPRAIASERPTADDPEREPEDQGPREGLAGPAEPDASRLGSDVETAETEAVDDRVRPDADEGERVCCPDDLCTGALDVLGRCGTCGRLAQDLGVERGGP
jgi:hypothetical protein